MSVLWCTLQAVTQADVLHPPLLQPVFSFWSPIPTRTRTITAQLQGNQILPFPAYQEQATLGAIKNSLSNVAIFVSLDAAIPSTAGAALFNTMQLAAVYFMQDCSRRWLLCMCLCICSIAWESLTNDFLWCADLGRKLLASRAVPYVNVTYDFDCFASLTLPTTVAVSFTSFDTS